MDFEKIEINLVLSKKCIILLAVTEEDDLVEPSQCSCEVPKRASRIVGGKEALANEYLWQVCLVQGGG